MESNAISSAFIVIKILNCYQNPQRDAGNVAKSYDMDLMKSSLEKMGGDFTLFGGEPLLLPEDDLEHLFLYGFEKFGKNGIQTNGTLINENHLRMFRQYNVSVGISIDGPDALNDIRWHGSLEKTRVSTKRTLESIDFLCAGGAPPGLIVTLHRGNATSEKLPIMRDWFRELDAKGIVSSRLHLLESENDWVRKNFALSVEENIAAFVLFGELEKELSTLRFDVFSDIIKLLLGRDQSTTCVWNACDTYTTKAVQGVEGGGQTSNCGRTNKDGVDFIKSNREGFERYMALFYTPQEYNGCKECRFFTMCKGQCPGTAVDGDWRNRTEHCDIWKSLFERMEDSLIAGGKSPLTKHLDLLHLVERGLLQAWAEGRNSSINDILMAAGQNPKHLHLVSEYLQANNVGYKVSNERLTHVDHNDMEFTR